MSDWDAIFGEAALGLDLAKIDLVRSARAQQAQSAGRSAASSVLTLLDPPRGPAAALTVAAPPAVSQDAIFRQEALEFRARGRDTPGGVVRLGARWLRWTYWMTLVLLTAAVTGIFFIRTDESTSGPAMVDGRTGAVAALLPAAAGPDLASSRGITVTLPGGRSVRITGLHARLADLASIRRAGLVPPAQPAILLTGRLSPGAATASVAGDAHLRAQASAVLRSESLADVLARQFGAMLGNGTAP
jgi:hypothetical protein